MTDGAAPIPHLARALGLGDEQLAALVALAKRDIRARRFEAAAETIELLCLVHPTGSGWSLRAELAAARQEPGANRWREIARCFA